MIAKTIYFCQVIIGLLGVVKKREGVEALNTQKRMAIRKNGCTVKGEGENISAPIVKFT